ncbi:hypothetical protein [Mycolicibacterium sp.]|uniref:hypothetical protein n=1 Tax=Mycolicibacterium sp. TaxID=2320850 RepID=UPI00355E29AF
MVDDVTSRVPSALVISWNLVTDRRSCTRTPGHGVVKVSPLSNWNLLTHPAVGVKVVVSQLSITQLRGCEVVAFVHAADDGHERLPVGGHEGERWRT